jgi:hypothetical protein
MIERGGVPSQRSEASCAVHIQSWRQSLCYLFMRRYALGGRTHNTSEGMSAVGLKLAAA